MTQFELLLSMRPSGCLQIFVLDKPVFVNASLMFLDSTFF
jgi:hypothetical protein